MITYIITAYDVMRILSQGTERGAWARLEPGAAWQVTTNTDICFTCKACTEPLTSLNALQLL